MLKSDADTLLLSAAERRISLYGLLNLWADATRLDKETNLIILDRKYRYFGLVELCHDQSAEILCSNETGDIRLIFDPDDESGVWLIDTDPQQETTMGRNRIFAKRSTIEAICTNGKSPDPRTVQTHPVMPDRSHVSDKLASVNQAAWIFWANAKRGDAATQPLNHTVIEWLQSHGLSQSQAEKATAIIKPDWAHTGRRPDQ